MKQHPIPQDITNYKFHLIGSMTLKQFAEVAVAAVLAFIIFKTNLIAIVKWPLIFFTVGLGAALAFVPIEERPLDHWIQTFFKNIYKPTKFFWKKASKIPDFFNYKISSVQSDFFAPNVNLNPARKQRINEYIKSIPEAEKVDEFDAGENQKISALLNQFNDVKVDQDQIKIEVKKQEKPNLQTRVRDLKAPQEELDNKKYSTNQIFGSVIGQNGQKESEVIIEIKDQSGESLRVIKSDEDGNFVANNPLKNGFYQVIAEKNDQKFPILQVELTGQILDPLVIKA
ncbi:PrgI family protein [Patescibacteria group bacterium]|nr:PrgI family protein [Patescibacteria group bacterium]